MKCPGPGYSNLELRPSWSGGKCPCPWQSVEWGELLRCLLSQTILVLHDLKWGLEDRGQFKLTVPVLEVASLSPGLCRWE